jgi:hypothetical protein
LRLEANPVITQSSLRPVAPCSSPTPYDQSHLALYAALIDAETAGLGWRDIAMTVLQLDPGEAGVEQCVLSHLQRAKWITSHGLRQAIEAFGSHTENNQKLV